MTPILEQIDVGLKVVAKLEARVAQLEKLLGIEGKAVAVMPRRRMRRKYQRKRKRVTEAQGLQIRTQILAELGKGVKHLKHLRKVTRCRTPSQLAGYLTSLHAEHKIARATETGVGYWRLPKKDESGK